jgi:hypothetical protein
MRVIGLLVAVAFVGTFSACTKGGNLNSVALDHMKNEFNVGMDRDLDKLFGKKPSSEKEKFKAYITDTTSFKVASVEKKSETESEVAIEIDQVNSDALGGIVLMGALGAGFSQAKGKKVELDIPAMIAEVEKADGKKIPHEQKTVKLLASLENDQWTFKVMPKERSTASEKKKK